MENISDTQAIISAIDQSPRLVVQQVGDLTYGVYPASCKTIDIQAEIDKRMPAPARHQGAIAVDTLSAFVALVGRYAHSGSVIYVHDDCAPRMVAVINDHDHEGAGWRDFRITYTPALSPEWVAWSKRDGSQMSQADFAGHLEDRCLDIISPVSVGPKTKDVIEQLGVRAATPAELQGLARGLHIKMDVQVKETRCLSSGETQIFYGEEHKDSDGKPLSVPNAFVIAIPVFVGGVGYSQVVRLRYKASSGRIAWSYSIVSPDAARRDAVLGMVAALQETLPGVLTVEGTP